jgi:hypothetical protein
MLFFQSHVTSGVELQKKQYGEYQILIVPTHQWRNCEGGGARRASVLSDNFFRDKGINPPPPR